MRYVPLSMCVELCCVVAVCFSKHCVIETYVLNTSFGFRNYTKNSKYWIGCRKTMTKSAEKKRTQLVAVKVNYQRLFCLLYYIWNILFDSSFPLFNIGDGLAILKTELKSQKKIVKSLKKKSLWSRGFEEVCVPTSLSFKITKSFLGCMFMFTVNLYFRWWRNW